MQRRIDSSVLHDSLLLRSESEPTRNNLEEPIFPSYGEQGEFKIRNFPQFRKNYKVK